MRLEKLCFAAGMCGWLSYFSHTALSQAVISQVYGGGGNAGSIYRNDFVELLNAGRDSVNLAGWSIQYAPAAGGTWQVTPLAGIVAPGYYYLVREAQGSGGTSDLPAPDAIGVIAMAATSGKVALVEGTVALSGACPAAVEIKDLVGYGSASCFEGSGAAPAPGNTVAAMRKNGGETDTQDNQADFITAAPTPRNGEYPPLPVQLVSFSATIDAPAVLLDWATLSEVNNFGFYIQRSEQGVGSLADIPGAFVPGNGTTSVSHAYSWMDPSPAPAQLWYRLRQVDLDGTVHYSPEVSVDATILVVSRLGLAETGTLQIWPNPFNPAATIHYTLGVRSEVELAIRDILGREVRKLAEGIQEPGAHEAVLDGTALSSGTYYCSLRTSGGVWVRRVVLVR